MTITNPAIINIRAEKLAIMKAGMDASKKTKIQYATKYAGTSNYWKYFIGQSKGLKSMKVMDKKTTIENNFRAWVNEEIDRKEKYGAVLTLIENAYEMNKSIALNRTYLNEAVFRGAEIMYWSFSMHNAIAQLPKEDKERTLSIRKIKKRADEFYKDYDSEIDQELFASMLEMYYYNIPKEQHASVFKKIENQLFGFKKLDFDWYAENTFKRSVFSSKEKFFNFLENRLLQKYKNGSSI